MHRISGQLRALAARGSRRWRAATTEVSKLPPAPRMGVLRPMLYPRYLDRYISSDATVDSATLHSGGSRDGTTGVAAASGGDAGGGLRFGMLTVFRARVVTADESDADERADGDTGTAPPTLVTKEALSTGAGVAAFWEGVAAASAGGAAARPVRVLVPMAAAHSIVQQALPAAASSPVASISSSSSGASDPVGSPVGAVASTEASAVAIAEPSAAIAAALSRESRPLGTLLSKRAKAEQADAAGRAPPRLPGQGSDLHDFVRNESAVTDAGGRERASAAPVLRRVDRDLLHAAEIGNVEVLRGLLAAPGRDRPDIHAPHDSHGGTALHLAAGAADVEAAMAAIDLLLAAGADVNARAANGATALHWAAGAGHVPVIRRLVAEGADPTQVSYTWRRQVFGKDSGMTPAHWAAQSGHAAAVEELAQLAAETIGALDERGRSPREVAHGEGHYAVADALAAREGEAYVMLELSVEQRFGQAM
mmetsp:Transcript_12782/g.44763  ORF Transcript_12782/g.44763 Transcript_12782/m.44763 type:complete len:480 (-) Transcript_12782:2120-3559(-)